MKPHLPLSALLIALGLASAQNRPPEIEALIERLGRYPLHDFDRSGWDTLWTIVYSHSPDGRNFIDHIKNDPGGDADGDGVSNFEEMLDFRNPWGEDLPARPQTPEEAKAARIAAAKAAREDDAKKIARFHSLLETRGALVRSAADPKEERREKEGKPATPAGNIPEETGEESSFYDEDFGEDGAWSQLMLCNTGTGPQIIFTERLSTGQYLLVWESDPEKLCHVEWSDDLVNWRQGATNLPTINGIGTWSQLTSAPRRFYRVIESENLETLPSDPSGGDGITTFGGSLSFSSGGFNPHQANVTVNLPAGIEASLVSLYVDGEPHSICYKVSTGLYRGSIRRTSLLPGSHSAYAVIDAVFETTPEPGVADPPSAGILRTMEQSFSVDVSSGFALGFRATETQIAPDDDRLPTSTTFLADIPATISQGFWRLTLRDSDGNTVREWQADSENYEPYLAISWNGAEADGDAYTASLEVGHSGRDVWPVTVAAGPRKWRMLCAMEDLAGWKANWDDDLFRPSWAPHFPRTSGGDEAVTPPTGSAWGPWGILRSCRPIVQHIKKSEEAPEKSLGMSGKWMIHQWASTATQWNDIDALTAFETGGNPFNNYEMGLFIGHGVACTGGAYAGPLGPSLLPPQHYMPMVKNNNTGEAYWVKSGTHPKYGAAGSKLKWMFMMTCNYMSMTTPNNIYSPMKTNGTLPFGPSLHVLCGYMTQIRLENKMGLLLSEALLQQPQNNLVTVVDAWRHVWSESVNSENLNGQGIKVARAVYWPETESDTIYGVDQENVAESTGAYNLNRLIEQNFPPN